MKVSFFGDVFIVWERITFSEHFNNFYFSNSYFALQVNTLATVLTIPLHTLLTMNLLNLFHCFFIITLQLEEQMQRGPYAFVLLPTKWQLLRSTVIKEG